MSPTDPVWPLPHWGWYHAHLPKRDKPGRWDCPSSQQTDPWSLPLYLSCSFFFDLVLHFDVIPNDWANIPYVYLLCVSCLRFYAAGAQFKLYSVAKQSSVMSSYAFPAMFTKFEVPFQHACADSWWIQYSMIWLTKVREDQKTHEPYVGKTAPTNWQGPGLYVEIV